MDKHGKDSTLGERLTGAFASGRLPLVLVMLAIVAGSLLWARFVHDEFWSSVLIEVGAGVALFLALELYVTRKLEAMRATEQETLETLRQLREQWETQRAAEDDERQKQLNEQDAEYEGAPGYMGHLFREDDDPESFQPGMG
jgi:hypothetical protein